MDEVGKVKLWNVATRRELITLELVGESAWPECRVPIRFSPDGDWLYFMNHYQGFLVRVRAATGEEPLGPFRLGGIYDVYSSPVGAAGRIYITGREGATLVIDHSQDPPEMLALNRLEDSFSASMAVVDGEIYLRGERYMYCIAR